MRLSLASTSPARLALLRAAGIEPVCIAPGVDEPAAVAAAEAEHGPLTTEQTVQLLARAKAEAVAAGLAAGLHDGRADEEAVDGFVLGGDSAFLIDGITHGKPHTPERARERWLAQRGRTGRLWSGHWLIDHRGGAPRAAVGRAAYADVTFADVTEAEIDAYIATGEPLEVAGAFTVDSLGGPFITRVEGDPSTVVGLSLSTLRELVRELGGEWTELWNRPSRA
ncbi:Maf family protein [Agromyces archimandritae]|uniref:Nucleoside triphosphate pyrophosphatase n=1 Tax=Agromyces archimandritae TaxID=2781962 RepID=A0A975FPJ9_9MICO|nr:Maf family nucleotide pyrophosphatase [Agromyces archimandritae]QTX05308.1 septum formation inhibitor Maf [Agromyces archimandritae]